LTKRQIPDSSPSRGMLPDAQNCDQNRRSRPLSQCMAYKLSKTSVRFKARFWLGGDWFRHGSQPYKCRFEGRRSRGSHKQNERVALRFYFMEDSHWFCPNPESSIRYPEICIVPSLPAPSQCFRRRRLAKMPLKSARMNSIIARMKKGRKRGPMNSPQCHGRTKAKLSLAATVFLVACILGCAKVAEVRLWNHTGSFNSPFGWWTDFQGGSKRLSPVQHAARGRQAFRNAQRHEFSFHLPVPDSCSLRRDLIW